ncbi:hypothetical protein ACIP93_33560 [Streptomyces sp. NPDC088745]|uniref:hypothetical protein n=1 Tax=Streptomyces sp. NPDC088745 TaxID=3365884 RepID=UPI0037FE4E90
MTPYERLMAEQWPTGRFGRDAPVQRRPLPPLPVRPPERRPIRPWTPEEQAQHFAELEAALSTWQDPTPAANRKREYHRVHACRAAGPRHLRLVPPHAQDSRRPGAEVA